VNKRLLAALVIGGISAFIYLHPDSQPLPVTERPAGTLSEERGSIPYDPAPRKPEAIKPAPTFFGYPCDGDCSDDRAGYKWAEARGLSDPDSCTGDSGEFIEGCRVYARRNPAYQLNDRRD